MWVLCDQMCSYVLLKTDPAPRSTACKIKGKFRPSSFHECKVEGRKRGARKFWAFNTMPWSLYTPQIDPVPTEQEAW